jgi:hypothetical protein
MSAHHAPKGVARTARILGGLIMWSGIVLTVACVLGFGAFQTATKGNSFNAFLWAESETQMLRPPLGEFLVGVALWVLGAVMAKVSPRVRKQRVGRRYAPVRSTYEVAYPQRRIGLRMLGLGLPALASGALMLAWWFSGRTEIADAGMEPALGSMLGVVFGATAAIAAGVAVVVGLVYRSSAPSEEESKRAELVEFAATQSGMPLPPPVPGPTPPMPAPPAMPA